MNEELAATKQWLDRVIVLTTLGTMILLGLMSLALLEEPNAGRGFKVAEVIIERMDKTIKTNGGD